MNYDISKKQVRYIQIMRRRVFGDNREAYLEMLWGVAKVKSCLDLKGAKIELVIRHLERCSGQAGRGPSEKSESRYIGEIKRRWARVSRVAREFGTESRQSIQALNRFVLRVAGVAAVDWLTPSQGQKVIEALKAMEGRK